MISANPSIIQTKFHRPSVPADFVYRERLHKQLDLALQAPLALVSAPAGYGKSVLVSHWAELLGVHCAWLSLDDTDSELRHFLAYLVAAIDNVAPGACRTTDELRQAIELPSAAVLAGHLINELDAIDERLVIVLDDYHRIGPSSPVHDLVGRILEHPPRQVHLVLTTRRDPPLELLRLRASGLVTEIRLQDLRFNGAETAALLTEKAGHAVSDDALGHLQREVEGWAVGLRLVVLAMGKADDPDGFLKGLQGGLPQMQEYLVQEVLAGLSPELRGCLLKSSILDRFCPELLESICPFGADSAPVEFEGREIVTQLCDSNIFTIALDAGGEWFRYHHLFQELLKRQLQRHVAPIDIEALHIRASEWFEDHGLVEEAIKHALKAGDDVRAAEIVERHQEAELEADQWFVVQSWLQLLPVDIKRQRKGLLAAQAWVETFQFDFENLYTTVERADSLVGDPESEPLASGELKFFRGFLSYYGGKGEESQRLCGEALAQHPEKYGMIAGEMEMYLALARQMTGEGESSIADVVDKIQSVGPGKEIFLSRMVGTEAFIHFLSGDLTRLQRAAERVTAIGRQSEKRYLQAWGHYLEAAARLHSFHLEDAMRGFLDVAERRDFVTRKVAVESLSGIALIHQFKQQPESARRAAKELIVFTRESGDLESTLAAESCRARLLLLQGDIRPAVEWARSVEITPSAPAMFFWLEDPLITRLRVQIAEKTEESLNKAIDSLGVLRPQLEALHNTCQTIEVAVLQALALHRQGHTDEALVALQGAVVLAEPGGWIRPFIEAGPAMAALLRSLGTWDEGDEFIGRILKVFSGHGVEAETDTTTEEGAGEMPAQDPTAPSDLTDREFEVLDLVAQRLNNKEIAARLFISSHTVNDHLKHIYQKLHVHGRRQAVVRATEAGILDHRS